MRYTISGEFVNPSNRGRIIRQVHRFFYKIREFRFSRSQTALLDATPVPNLQFPLSVPLPGAKEATIVIDVATEEEHDEVHFAPHHEVEKTVRQPEAPAPSTFPELEHQPGKDPFSVQHELDRTIVSKRPCPVGSGPAQVDAEDGIAESNLAEITPESTHPVPEQNVAQHHGGNTDSQFHLHSSRSFSRCIILTFLLVLLIVSLLHYHHSRAVAAVSHRIEVAKSHSINSHHVFEHATLVAGTSSTNAKIVERHAEVAVEVAKNGLQWASKCVELAAQRVGDDRAKIAQLEVELDKIQRDIWNPWGVLRMLRGAGLTIFTRFSDTQDHA
ncbi:hypothetical protein BS47DRAFT_1363054 [Hydnum rufescens UP504]|uniref:Uncharacterized protein n=1 Tax=Hydnum rufescens UP504 TaxID=1448309 RepID=A0A9P6AUZ6_9AGAM|nr:hypothetical protein BS47DRAFT_1363054 [Hydnum rufescens UP504]